MLLVDDTLFGAGVQGNRNAACHGLLKNSPVRGEHLLNLSYMLWAISSNATAKHSPNYIHIVEIV